jgi:alanine dehydrogenase
MPMIIGVPKERKTLEKRVALTPDGAHELVKSGHQVLVEKGAGDGSFYEDPAYKKAGATLVSTLEEVWTRSELVVKVKEPHPSEYQYFRPGLAIFDYLHLAGMPEVTQAMLQGGVTGIAYELVQSPDGRLPLLEPMSEVAGKLAVQVGAYFLLEQNGGRGVLLGGTVGVPPANVVIVGAGIAGRAACQVALGMGACVTILDVNYSQLTRVQAETGHRARTIHSTQSSLARECVQADLLIAAVLIPGARAPKIITREIVRSMPNGSVLVDISIDQGGCAETIRPTSLEDPVFKEEGVIHYGVPNMPAQTARTSTRALTAVTLPYIMKIAGHGVCESLRCFEELRGALCTHKGRLTNQRVSEAVGLACLPPLEALSL